MSDPDGRAEAADPWLTVAEIAEELRVNPATVRLWITKEILPAKRAGRRKLLIRRSDLEEMLHSAQEQPGTGPAADDDRGGSADRGQPLASVTRLRPERESHPSPVEDALITLKRLQASDETWARAQSASQNAPPDAGFPRRLHALALAAEDQSRALAAAATNSRMRWAPTKAARGVSISHELRPGGNRPGPVALWAEFDRCVQRLEIAMESPDVAAIAARWHDLALVMHSIVDALEDDLGQTRQGQR
jgi:excisionase family DNA binding protein